MMTRTGPRMPGAGRAFTLVELLLALVLILLLSGVMVISFSDWEKNSRLEEGSFRLESLARFARAQAANTGHRVRLNFGVAEDGGDFEFWAGKVSLEWEPDPFGRPGEFEILADAQPQVDAVNELVQIEDVLTPGATPGSESSSAGGSGTNAAPAGGGARMGLEEAMASYFSPVNFQPDGSSDSAEIIVFSPDLNTSQRMKIRIDGLTGLIRREPVRDPADAAEEEDWSTNEPGLEGGNVITRRSSSGTRDTSAPRDSSSSGRDASTGKGDSGKSGRDTAPKTPKSAPAKGTSKSSP